jgi:4'-phosphopantetheinyl transferase
MHVSPVRGDPSFDLSDSRIEVWCVETATAASVIRQLETVLSAEETERAARFQFERHRNAFVVSRGALRVLLSRYTRGSVADIVFAYGSKGKPFLPDSGVDFNVSHTEGVALLAFAQDCALGVDVEHMRPVDDMMQIAKRFFSRGEAEELAALPEEQRETAFFRCWTRKEAYIKAVGDGLSMPLSAFRVSFKEGDPVRWINVGNETSAQSDWTLYNLDVPSAYAAAIAHRGEYKKVVLLARLPTAQLVDLARFS